MEEKGKAATPTTFGKDEFSPSERGVIKSLLQQKLGNSHLSTRPGSGGATFTYVESWKVIELANQIFGFNGWSCSVVDITPDFIEESAKGRYCAGVTAVVKVALKDGTFHEDVGFGMSEHPKKGSAIEKAKKEAVSDARKRALRLFGNALGNCIYDKAHVRKVRRGGELDVLPETPVNPYIGKLETLALENDTSGKRKAVDTKQNAQPQSHVPNTSYSPPTNSVPQNLPLKPGGFNAGNPANNMSNNNPPNAQYGANNYANQHVNATNGNAAWKTPGNVHPAVLDSYSGPWPRTNGSINGGGTNGNVNGGMGNGNVNNMHIANGGNAAFSPANLQSIVSSGPDFSLQPQTKKRKLN